MGSEQTYDYAREKFWQAIHTLAAEDGSIQERLEWSAQILIRLAPHTDLPEALRAKFKTIMHDLTEEQPEGKEGTIRATTRRLTPEAGKDIATRILDIYTELHGGI